MPKVSPDDQPDYAISPRRNYAPAQGLAIKIYKTPYQTTLLLTLRADFYGHAIGLSRELSDHLEHGLVNLGPMTRAELREAIEKPARRVGLEFESGLLDRVLGDVSNEPGNLPLLEFALTELWARREGRKSTHDAYEKAGHVSGAIATRAEAEFSRFTPEEQAAARRLFTRLVRVARPEEGGEDTRQRADVRDADPVAQHVVRMLTDARLLVTSRDAGTGEPMVEVAHEALIRSWERLRGWVNEDREFLLWRQRLRALLAAWEETGQSDDALLAQAMSAEAAGWMERRGDSLTPEEQRFIGASRRHHEAQEQRLKELYDEAQRQRELASARQLAAQAELARSTPMWRLDLCTLLAVESMRRAALFENDRALRQALNLLPRTVASFRHSGHVEAVAFSSDGRYLATGSRGEVRMFEVRSGKEVARRSHQHRAIAIAFGRDGRYVVLGSGDQAARVFEVGSGKEVARLGCQAGVNAVAFSPYGRYVATGSNDQTAQVFEVGAEKKWRG